MTRNASVPHHRVDAATHARAKALAEQHGVSLSQVAESGLLRYIENNPALSAANTERKFPALPHNVVTALSAMKHDGDARLDSALATLHSAGWSFATLAAPVGLSRQAVHLRVSRAAAGWPLALAVPEGPGRGVRSTTARFDWAVWVDPGTYKKASRTARQRGDLMRDVMESILNDYIAGDFTVETADVSPESTYEKATTR